MSSRERRRSLWILVVALFLFHAASGVVSPLLPRLRQALDASYPQIGWVNAAFGLSRLLVNVPAGWLLRRRSPNLLVFVGMGIVALGNLVAALAGSVYGVIAGRAVAGVGYSAAVIGTLALLASLATHASGARVFSLYESLIVAGLALSSTLTGLVVGWAGWRAGFALGVLLAVLALVMAAVSLRGGPLVGAAPAPADSRTIPRPGTAGGWTGMWAVGLVFFLSLVLSYAWTGLFYTLYPLYGGERLGLGAGAVGMALSMGYVADLALLFPCGWMADRYGRVPILFAWILVIVLTALALPFSGSDLSYLGIGLLIGVGFACWGLPPALLTDWVSSNSRGLILGFYRFMVDLGFILGPWSIGVLLERGGYRVAAWTIAALTGAGALTFFGLRGHPAPTVRGAEAEVGD